MGAVTATNLYGQDGTALWLTLTTPGSERADVRGRQLAWLATVRPDGGRRSTVAGGVASGHPELWPWALAATAALLGGGRRRCCCWSRVDQLVPGPIPREHKDAPLDHADVTGPAFVTMLLVPAGALPALGVVALGEERDSALLAWLGVPVGALTGGAAYVLLGRAAYRGLAARGPDLLYLMRAGKELSPRGRPPRRSMRCPGPGAT